MTDLLLLTNNVFKLVVTQLESMDVNMMSIVFSGYRFYQLYFERVWKENLSEDEIAQEMSKISRRIC